MISNNISIKYSLSNNEKNTYLYPYYSEKEEDGSVTTGVNNKRYISQYITNCGNGSAIGFNISIKRDNGDTVETIPVPIYPNEKVYIAFCITGYRESVTDGEYTLTYKFSDIYENTYRRYQKLVSNKEKFTTGLFLKKI